MPSIIPDPSMELVNKIKSLESRVQSLEVRARRGLPWEFLATYDEGGPYASGDRVQLSYWSRSALLTDSMVNAVDNTITIPHTGKYLMMITPPHMSGTVVDVNMNLKRESDGATVWSFDFSSYAIYVKHTIDMFVLTPDDIVAGDKLYLEHASSTITPDYYGKVLIQQMD